MSIKFCNGDLLESGCSLICHQVNCQGVMGSGIAKSIREKWPEVYSQYKHFCNEHDRLACELYGGYENGPVGSDLLLGKTQKVEINDKQAVINMFSQLAYGYDGNRYTSYDAFYNCLCEIILHAKLGSRIGFPHGIGSVRGGANWNIILKMIEEVLGEDYQVEIWRFDRG
jgi:O-acetyl-ADP-ribose deacetylase (regulator of RNase III)